MLQEGLFDAVGIAELIHLHINNIVGQLIYIAQSCISPDTPGDAVYVCGACGQGYRFLFAFGCDDTYPKICSFLSG